MRSANIAGNQRQGIYGVQPALKENVTACRHDFIESEIFHVPVKYFRIISRPSCVILDTYGKHAKYFIEKCGRGGGDRESDCHRRAALGNLAGLYGIIG
jgi:hypothetical protein